MNNNQPSILLSLQAWLEQHKLQWGSQVEIQLRSQQTVRGQLVPPPDPAAAAVYLANPDGASWGFELFEIASVRETGFHPWPPQEKPIELWDMARSRARRSTKNTTKPTTRSARPLSLTLETSTTSWFSTNAIATFTPEVRVVVVGCKQTLQDSSFSPLENKELTLETGHKLKWERAEVYCDAANPWKALCLQLEKAVSAGVSGVVIVHERDSMLQSAKALSWMLQDSPIPLVFVGVGSAGRFDWAKEKLDIKAACMASVMADSAEVLLCVPRDVLQEEYKLLRATHSEQTHSTHRSGFTSPGQTPVGSLKKGEFQLHRPDSLPRFARREIRRSMHWTSDVTCLQVTPGMPPSMLQAIVSNPPQGVVLGVSSIADLPQSWAPHLQSLQQRNVPIYIVSQASTGSASLSSTLTGRRWRSLGMQCLPPILLDTAHSKLCWSLGKAKALTDVDRWMQTPIAGEFQTNR